MKVNLPNQSSINSSANSKMAVTVADAVLLFYKSVKDRKIREMINQIQNGNLNYERI